MTPLRVARLLETGADPSHALDNAARAGHTEIVRILLEAGASPSGALDDAARKGHTEIVRILLEAGAHPSGALDDAAGAEHIEIVQILLAAGAAPSRGLSAAAGKGHGEIVRTLLDAGADPSVGLSAAAGQGHGEIVRTLLDAGADPSVGLSAAARWGRTEIIAVLLETGGDPNASRWVYRSRLSLTPLHGAALRGHLAAAELLIEAGADIKARARYKAAGLGETIGAVFASILIPFASPDDLLNVELADMDGWTPFQFASAAGHTEIVDLLTDASEVVAAPAAAGKTTEKPVAVSGNYTGGLWIALDSSGTVTGRHMSYRAGLGTVEQPQFSCVFSFYGFPAGEGEEYVIASWDPPVWRPDAAVEEGINTTGTLRVVEGSALIQFVDDPSGGCWNVAPFRQGTRFRLRESRAWSQVRLAARDARLLVSPGGAAQPEPPLKRGELTLVLEERDGWLLVEVERVGPSPMMGRINAYSEFGVGCASRPFSQSRRRVPRAAPSWYDYRVPTVEIDTDTPNRGYQNCRFPGDQRPLSAALALCRSQGRSTRPAGGSAATSSRQSRGCRFIWFRLRIEPQSLPSVPPHWRSPGECGPFCLSS